MEITDELREARKTLEGRIEALIEQFQTDTGCEIANLEIEQVWAAFAEKPMPVVRVSVRLD